MPTRPLRATLPPRNQRMRKVGFYFEPGLARRLRIAAAEEDMTLTALVIRFCEEGLARRPKRGG
jgi:hypothetical protein